MGTTEGALHCNMGATVSGELGSLFQDLLMPVCDQRNHEKDGVDSVETFLKGQTEKNIAGKLQESLGAFWRLTFFLLSCH